MIQTTSIPALLDELKEIDSYSLEESRGLAEELGAACRTLLRENEKSGEALRRLRVIYDELYEIVTSRSLNRNTKD